MSIETPTLGQPCTVDLTHRLFRVAVARQDGRRGQVKRWVRMSDQWGERPSWLTPDIRTGVVVGLRTTTDGVTTYGYDEPTEYRATSGSRAVLVAWDIRKKPALFRPEDVNL